MSFATGFTKGFIRQSEMNQARREKEADREFTAKRDEESFERQKELVDYKAQLETRQQLLLNNISSSRRSSDKNSDKLSTAFAQLQAIGVDEENLRKIQSTDNTESITNITKMISDQYEAALEAGPTMAQEFRSNINQYLETGLVINPSENVEFEFQGEIFGTTQPGSAGLVFDERPVAPEKLEEVIKVEDYITREAARQASTEQTQLDSAKTTINSKQEKLDPETRAVAEEAMKVILHRRELLGTASEAWEENSDPTGLFQLFGTPNAEKLLDSLGTRVTLEQLSPVYGEDFGSGFGYDWSMVSEERLPDVKELLRRLNLYE